MLASVLCRQLMVCACLSGAALWTRCAMDPSWVPSGEGRGRHCRVDGHHHAVRYADQEQARRGCRRVGSQEARHGQPGGARAEAHREVRRAQGRAHETNVSSSVPSWPLHRWSSLAARDHAAYLGSSWWLLFCRHADPTASGDDKTTVLRGSAHKTIRLGRAKEATCAALPGDSDWEVMGRSGASHVSDRSN